MLVYTQERYLKVDGELLVAHKLLVGEDHQKVTWVLQVAICKVKIYFTLNALWLMVV